MVCGVKEKYEMVVLSHEGMNLLDATAISAYIVQNIKAQITECVASFEEKHGNAPTIIRAPGAIQQYFKDYLELVRKESYISDRNVDYNGIPVETNCKASGLIVVLEYWEPEV